MDSCLISTYSYLALLGLRNWLLELFAFPHYPLPTYTFRSAEIEKFSSQPLQTQEACDKQGDSQQQYNEEINEFENGLNSNLRIYRISSVIIEQDNRIYKLPQQRHDTPQLKKQFENYQKQNKKIKFRKPFDKEAYPQMKLRLINSERQLYSSIEPQDILMNGYYLINKFNCKFATLVVQMKLVECDYCIIHSHGNSPDIGIMVDTYLDLCFNLKVCVIGYDYPGYGQSEKSSDRLDEQCISNLESVYQFTIQQLGFKPQNIILYGQSIGTGPSVYLASKPDKFPVGGLIIHSGFKSALSVIKEDMKQIPKEDFFVNIKNIETVICKILIIHGINDTQIGIRQAQELAEKAEQFELNFKFVKIDEAGHNDIELDSKFRKLYFHHLQTFVDQLILFNKALSEDDVRNLYQGQSQSRRLQKENRQFSIYNLRNSNKSQQIISEESLQPEIEMTSSFQIEQQICQQQHSYSVFQLEQEQKTNLFRRLTIQK